VWRTHAALELFAAVEYVPPTGYLEVPAPAHLLLLPLTLLFLSCAKENQELKRFFGIDQVFAVIVTMLHYRTTVQ
jgi:hypothetical protein